MCGIAGIVKHGRAEPELRSQVETMLGFLKERGPDAEGVVVNDEVAFGHTRLSIIDLDERSNQPFVKDDEVIVTFNGEIYNFRALRAELEAVGQSFRTDSDTEVLALGYLHWGAGILERLDGMFAVGLVDLRARKVLLARDPFGQKPLYYFYSKTHGLVFSSDIRAVKSVLPVTPSLDTQALDYYLSELSVPQPRTIWREISQIGPASALWFDLNTWEIAPFRYWELPASKSYHQNEEEVLLLVEQRLTEAILKRTVADVPVGCFLSGGVDSGLVVSLLASNSSAPVATFTVGLKDHPQDESSRARAVASRYRTEHTQIYVEHKIAETLTKLSTFAGEPFADSSIIPSFLIAREIRSSVKVALSGDGGDEMFGGYPEYLLAHKTDLFLRDVRPLAFWKARVLADKIASRVSGRENLGAYDHYARLSGAQRLYRQMGFCKRGKASLWKPEVRPEEDFAWKWLDKTWNDNRSELLSTTLLRSSLKTRLINDYLVKVDRSSMLNSLEVRSPFLDKKLAVLACEISPDLLFKNLHQKYILKKLAQKYVDPNVFQQTKGGFSIPIGRWLRSNGRSFFEERVLAKEAWLWQFFRKDEVVKLWEAHQHQQDQTHRIWALLCLEMWAQNECL